MIAAGAGDDVISARGGDDVVCAGSDDDLGHGGHDKVDPDLWLIADPAAGYLGGPRRTDGRTAP